MKVGILIPQSTVYPLLPVDFIRGLKLSVDDAVELFIEDIGNATSSDQVIAKAQKLVLENDVHLIIAYVGNKVANELYPKVEAMEKGLILVNLGEDQWCEGVFPNLLYHHFGLVDSAFLMGNSLKEPAGNMVQLVGQLEAGYQFISCFEDALRNQGGGFCYRHYINESVQKVDVENLEKSIEQLSPNLKGLYVAFSYAQAENIIKYLEESAIDRQVPIYASPMMLTNKTLSKFEQTSFKIKSVSSWSDQLENKENIEFIAKIGKEKASPFSLMGYEIGLLLSTALNTIKKEQIDSNLLIQQMKTIRFSGPRGLIEYDSTSGLAMFDLYSTELQPNEQRLVQKIVDVQSKQMPTISSGKMPKEIIPSGWINPYLCI